MANTNKENEFILSKDLAKYLVPVALLASFIAWFRNGNSNIILRLIYCIIAYIFNVFYLFYVVYKWFCK